MHTTGSPLATFDHAVVIERGADRGPRRSRAVSTSDQAAIIQIQAEIAAMVADGEANFDSSDVSTLLLNVLDVVTILTNIDCDGLL
jgi:hypothetical protein